MPTSQSPEARNVALFGQRVFADLIRLRTSRGDHLGLSRFIILDYPKYDDSLYKRQRKRHRHKGKAMWRRKHRLQLYSHKPRTAWRHQKLEEPVILPSRLQIGCGPDDSLSSDFWFLASRTVRDYSVVLSHQVCGICYNNLRKLIYLEQIIVLQKGNRMD